MDRRRANRRQKELLVERLHANMLLARGGLLWAMVVVLFFRMLTSRSSGTIHTPEFANLRKMELDPLIPVVVGVIVVGAFLSPRESVDIAHSFYGLGVVLLMYMFVKAMGGVGQHANIYSIVPFVLIFVLCIGILPIFSEVFHSLVKATRFRPHIYVPEDDEDMTPVGYFGGLFDTLVWFEGSTGKIAFIRLALTYAFMSCMACDEVVGPTAKFKSAILYYMKMDKHESTIDGIAGNFNSMWIYSIMFEMIMAMFSHSYVRMACSMVGFCIGYVLQLHFLKPIWSGRGIQNCLTRLRTGMSFCLGDAFQGGRRLVLRLMTSFIVLTYLITGQFDQMIAYIFDQI